MRKWMRERLQGRKKKKASEPADQPAPPPLQPAYFDPEESPAPAGGDAPRRSKAPDRSEPEVESDPAAPESSSAESAAPEAQSGTAAEARRARGRRRRGGRGRGARGREQAVAQAFTPAAVKSVAPDVSAEPAESTDAEASAPQTEAPVAVPQAPAVSAAAPRPPKGIVVLAIGLPGSGKSTWFKRHNLSPLSSDMVRSLLFDDVREQRFQDLVFSNLRSMLKARLIAKRPMNYVDATNLTPQERQHWIKLAKDYNYEVHAVFFDVPLDVCIERHQRRDRVVPEDVVRRMAAKLKPPSFDEGFAKITVVRVKKKEQEHSEA
jgi:predicted kinase